MAEERILVVDDDPDALALITLTLRRHGYAVQTAPGGAEALDILAGDDLPDLVLLDLMMPFVDGFEVCSQMRADPRTATLPVVMLTAKAQASSRIEGLQLGADDYVTKPVYPDELISRIRAVLEHAAKARSQEAGGGLLVGCLGVKGGLGVTTVALNLALVLSTHGQAVLADFFGDALLYAGYSPFNQPGRLGKLGIEQIDREAIEHSWVEHSDTLHLLYDADLLTSPARGEIVLNCLAEMVDFGVLDMGAWTFATTASYQWIIKRCQAIVLVAAAGAVETERAQRILLQLDEWGVTAPIHVVSVSRQAALDPLETTVLASSLGREVLGVIPHAPHDTPWLAATPTEGDAARAFHTLADALIRSRQTQANRPRSAWL